MMDKNQPTLFELEIGDHDIEDDEDHKYVTNLSCPKCGSFVYVYWSDEKGKNSHE
jgi:hypothetical protein